MRHGFLTILLFFFFFFFFEKDNFTLRYLKNNIFAHSVYFKTITLFHHIISYIFPIILLVSYPYMVDVTLPTFSHTSHSKFESSTCLKLVGDGQSGFDTNCHIVNFSIA
jgi:hypothetical protein